MGKPTGFIDYSRQEAADRPAAERLADYGWIHTDLDPEQRRQQAGRCMDCGVPFCSADVCLHGVAQGCPLHNLIPEWNEQLWNGRLPLALERLHKTNCFPEFTGYVCPAPCERACSCAKSSAAVTINQNERYIIDEAFAQGLMEPHVPATRSGKTVAVVGSGPAGLTAATLLNQRGHAVTVYERSARPGGLLTYGIPSMKLPQQVIDRRVALLEAEGIRFACNANVGVDVTVEELAASYDAVVLALGAQQPRPLSFDGRANGVCYALDYLGAAAQNQLGENDLDPLMDASGKVVAVVGAGDTANDCIATALRQGATDVIQLIRRPAADYGPATDYAHQESEAALGRDIRRFQTQVAAVAPDADGNLAQLTLTTPDGPQEVAAQLLVIASGFTGAETYATEGADLDALPNLFQAGDMATGASLVVRAMAHARSTARAVDEYLTGYSTIR
ncbi:MAG: glutamate synthase subunit beta [Coriobacteriia bacterium]|nr:glutamate synthase subunit beta [Coriobacteriia bacterium]